MHVPFHDVMLVFIVLIIMHLFSQHLSFVTTVLDVVTFYGLFYFQRCLCVVIETLLPHKCAIVLQLFIQAVAFL